MRAKREPFDKKWDEYDTNTNSESFYDNDGFLNPNEPVEKVLGEIYM